MARQLASSERTIESHLSHVYAKLEVRGRAEVIARFFWQTYLPSVECAGLDSNPANFGDALGATGHFA